MMNNVIMVGRLVQDPETTELTENKKACTMTLAVQRPYKNMDGIYETDFINCVVWEHVAETTIQYLHKGDVVGIKGRLQTQQYEENGEKKSKLVVVAERITFLSTGKKEEKNDTANN